MPGKGPPTFRVGAVFFDLFGTLLTIDALADACEEIAPGGGAEVAARWRAAQLEITWLRTAMGAYVDFEEVTRDALVQTVQALGLDIPPVDIERLAPAFEALPLHPAVPGVLDTLRDRGIATGILSNASRGQLDRVVARTGLATRLDHSLSVDAVRRFKPDPAVYRLATEAAGVAPAGIGFVTGNGWDAAGAGAFGLRVAWLRPGPAARLPTVGAPDPAIASWETLEGVFIGE